MPSGQPYESLVAKVRVATRSHLKLGWEKALERLGHDPDGAITAARSLLESVCKHVLDVGVKAYGSNWDLPKLYSESSKELGISASGAVGDLNRKPFGAAHTVVQSVSELRNRAGDAHGKGLQATRPSRADAELTVNLAGSITTYILSALDSHIAATTRMTPEGEVILRFDKATIWRLVDHATHSRDHYTSTSQEVLEPALWLVGDAGVYLMSNGKPALLQDGELLAEGASEYAPRLTAHAESCTSSDELDHWWPIHNAIDDGNDFCYPLELDYFRRALTSA